MRRVETARSGGGRGSSWSGVVAGRGDGRDGAAAGAGARGGGALALTATTIWNEPMRTTSPGWISAAWAA